MSEIDRQKRSRRGFDRALWVWLALFAVVAIAILVVGTTLSERLASIEDELAYSPPWITSDTLLESESSVAKGQTIYVPVYSHIYHRGGRPFLLETTLSVRNLDPAVGIVVESVRYYDSQGAVVRDYLDAPLRLGPLSTAEFLVPREETSGGSGASFVLRWVADEEVREPIVEAVMVGTDRNHGIAFTSRGRVLGEIGEDQD